MLPIEEYGCIGDCRSLALVGTNGAIEWLCWPRFDSPPAFWSLLDSHGGFWSLAPNTLERAGRRYLDDTNVLCTEFSTATGRCRVLDFMPVSSEPDKHHSLRPEHELMRIVEGVEGFCEVSMSLRLRPDFGASQPTIRRLGPSMVRFTLGRRAWLLVSERELQCSQDGEVKGAWQIAAGQRLALSLGYGEDGPLVLVPLGERPATELSKTLAWWRNWIAQANYQGQYRSLVRRSLLTLKLLSYAPSGAIVAAGTTSLPERPGGDLNWDYRYAWVRDASFTVRALLDLGYRIYAKNFVGWLLHSTRLTRPELRVLYDVYGRPPPREHTLPTIEGWHRSKPVRIGNAADRQLQLDGYGEVIDAVAQLVNRTNTKLDDETQGLLVDFGSTVCRHWREPDSGIWEIRGQPQHFTHSKVMCWVALDRLLSMHHRGCLSKVPREQFESQRDAIQRLVDEEGYNRELGCYTQTLGGHEVDASLLQLAWYGYREARDPRMRNTYLRIADDLRTGEIFLLRYPRSRTDREGAFGICSFWAVEFLARGGGDVRAATDLFERLIGHANDLGLFAEQLDPQTGAALGNFPQAFTHVGLINAALALDQGIKHASGGA